MQITMQGKYRTRDGRAVRILATDFQDGCDGTRIIGIVPGVSVKGDRLLSWDMCGNSNSSSSFDLIPVPEPKPVVHQMWAVMEDGTDTIKYSSYCKQDAEWHSNVFLHETVRLIQWNT